MPLQIGREQNIMESDPRGLKMVIFSVLDGCPIGTVMYFQSERDKGLQRQNICPPLGQAKGDSVFKDRKENLIPPAEEELQCILMGFLLQLTFKRE